MSIKSANLENTNLSDTFCLFTFFQGSRLNNANFAHADLDAANFHNCVLKNADFSGARLKPIETGAEHENGKKQRWRPNFAGAILVGADFSGAYVSGANFKEADLTGLKVDKAVFLGCDFDDGIEEQLGKHGAMFKLPEKPAKKAAKEPDGKNRRPRSQRS